MIRWGRVAADLIVNGFMLVFAAGAWFVWHNWWLALLAVLCVAAGLWGSYHAWRRDA